MSDSQKQPPPNHATMPCPVYLYAGQKENGAWRVVSYQVLFAEHDGYSAKLYVCHPAFGGLVTADEVNTHYPAVLMIDPSAEEAEEAMLLVRAKAVASELPWQGKGPGRTGTPGRTRTAWTFGCPVAIFPERIYQASAGPPDKCGLLLTLTRSKSSSAAIEPNF